MVQTAIDSGKSWKEARHPRRHVAVFRRKGLQATGIWDIAAELMMAVGNLHDYFLDDLPNEVIETA